MGAWGIGEFENDNALDFVNDVTDGAGLKRIETAIDSVVNARSEYLEAPEAEEGLAAAAILVRLKNPTVNQQSTPLELSAWLSKAEKPTAELTEKARQAVSRVLTAPSELLELWSESDEFEAWKASVEAIAAQL